MIIAKQSKRIHKKIYKQCGAYIFLIILFMSLSCYFLKLIRSPQLIDISVTKNEVEIEIEEKLSELVKNIPLPKYYN